MINGINPSSFNDYPKEVSYVIFLGGCNFRCPFCHNSTIVNKENAEISLTDVVESLRQRKKFIKAVVVTGGEPTIYGDRLLSLLDVIKSEGFKVKLDTNGTNPDLIKKIIDCKKVDYIAMDIKNTFSKYAMTAGVELNDVIISKIKRSINLIENSGIDYEFRTTINRQQHTLEDIKEMSTYVNNRKKYFLQNYQYSREQICKDNFGAFEEQNMEQFKDLMDVGVKI